MLKKILLILCIIYAFIYVQKANKFKINNERKIKWQFYHSEISLEEYEKAKKENTLINQILNPIEVLKYEEQKKK